jgi:hypothetical protein
MELKSLILGILFSVGIFAVKSGVGLYYFLGQRQSLKMKMVWGMLYSIFFSMLKPCRPFSNQG